MTEEHEEICQKSITRQTERLMDIFFSVAQQPKLGLVRLTV